MGVGAAAEEVMETWGEDAGTSRSAQAQMSRVGT
jgi:hypothetical protein